VLDLCGTENRRNHAADLLQTQGDTYDRVRARDQVKIGWQKGRGVDQAKAGHAQHAMQVVSDIVAFQIVPDEALIGLFLGSHGICFQAHLRLCGAFQNIFVQMRSARAVQIGLRALP
jgi:hypothetical protein